MRKTYKLYTDGSHNFHKKIAGYGGYLQDGNETVLTFSEIVVDKDLNDKHELLGIKRGLELALEFGVKHIKCYTDDQNSALLLNTQSKKVLKKKIKNSIQKDIINLRKQFDSFTIHYLPREENEKADKLSREAIKNIDVEIIKSKGFFSDKILTGNLVKPENKLNFIDKISKVENYFVFDKSESDNNVINVYHVKRVNEKLEHTLLEEVRLVDNNQKYFLQLINDTLKKYGKSGECVCFNIFNSKATEYALNLFRQNTYIIPSVKKVVEELHETLENFDMVYFQSVQDVSHYLKDKIAKNKKNVQFEMSEENIHNAIKELGDENYTLGQNPTIESALKQKKEKSDTEFIIDLQNHYLNKFIRIGIGKIIEKKTSFDEEDNKEAIVKKEIEKIRGKLISQGVNLRTKMKGI